MGNLISRKDFEWVASDEPHATRRKLILAKYGDKIKPLMKVDPFFKYHVTLIVLFQIATLIVLRNVTNWWILLFCSYFITGVFNHALMFAVHEIAHRQAFGHNRPLANKIFGMFANLPLGVPVSISFKKYHLDHHRYQGDDYLDTDIPTSFEAKFFNTTFLKLIWIILQPVFYTFRPIFVAPKPFCYSELINVVIQFLFDYAIGIFLGWRLLFYLLLSTFLTMGLHPIAGHFISEHYLMFNEDEVIKNRKNELQEGVDKLDGRLLIPETCSYYGILNYLTFNVGYHVEHHDFPSIPGSKLPLLQEIAPEFYKNLYHHTSWVKVIYQYITDPSIGPYSRVKRVTKKDKLHQLIG